MVLLARKDEEGNTQTLYDHLHGAGRLASGFEDEFADISRTAAVLHDVGKVAQQFKEGDFEDNKALSPMFLLGYSCQRRASRRKAQEISQKNNSNN